MSNRPLDPIDRAIIRGHLRVAQANLRWRMRWWPDEEVRETLETVEEALEETERDRRGTG